ncbi:sensor histidine kinase [Ornithinimicrobium avium]|uniref:sensor histidine kinase n=1 Tax=Ornithinimicrobium avium TaxID=2283195 RepID=UPI0013B42632|nr:histidine kinase [Ornithinimicrobium avium]
MRASLLRPAPLGTDIALAAAIAAGSVLSLRSQGQGWGVVALQVSAALSLGARRLNPLVPAVVVLACTAVQTLVLGSSPDDVFYLAIWLVGVFACGAYLPLGQALLGLALWGVTLLAGVQGGVHAGDAFFMGILTVGGFVPGVLSRRAETSREEAVLLARRRELDTAGAVAAERAGLARELHDVVAHAIGVMVVHAGVAEANLGRDTDRARQALVTVQTSGDEAVQQLRRLLHLLRDGDEAAGGGDAAVAPLPSLEQLDVLVDRVRRAGHEVRVERTGGAAVPPAVSLTAYRIVQESLTNVMKHAPGAAVDLAVRRTRPALEISVVNDLPAGAVRGDGGFGQLGLAERVAVFDGTFSAGEQDGRYVVHARLPLGGPA